jgi:DegV family protein with EDD domain
VSRVAVVTDSASDMPPDRATALGVAVVPLAVNFGSESYKAGVDMSADEFWTRMTAPDAPFPTTAASAPGDFKAAYDGAFEGGAEAIVSIHVAGSLSGTLKSAEVARAMLADREIHVVDSWSASMGVGILAEMAVEMARLGVSAAEIARVVSARAEDVRLWFALDTLEYLRKGGRISGAQAMIGGLLSVKPIIDVAAGKVNVVERIRTRSKARERLTELMTARPIERLVILHAADPDAAAFRDQLLARATGPFDRTAVPIVTVGPSIGPHIGPGGVGAAVLYSA